MNSLSPRQRILDKLWAAQVQPMACPDAAAFYKASAEDQATRVERLMLNMKNAMAEVHRTSASALAQRFRSVLRMLQWSRGRAR